MTVITDNIMLAETMEAYRASVAAKLRNAQKSLELLSKKDGLYAWEHRRLISMYREIVNLVEAHQELVAEAKTVPLPPVDEHGIEILF